jgi:hypothetical protein
MTEATKWEWRTGSKEMLAWISDAVVGSPSAWDETDDDEIDPIAVMGQADTRSDWVGAITPDGRRTMKSRDRPDLARRYFISRAQSPVGNFFEKKKPEWTREQQINAFRDYVWDVWLQKENMPEGVDRWLRARAQEVIAGRLIDLVSDSREFSRKKSGFMSKNAPYDCHGHVIRALILIKAGQITKEDYFAAQAEYLLKMEGDPMGLNWKQEAKEIMAAREASQDGTKSDPWSD